MDKNEIRNEIVSGMCATQRHDFYLMTPAQQAIIRSNMEQLYDNNVAPTISKLVDAHKEEKKEEVAEKLHYRCFTLCHKNKDREITGSFYVGFSEEYVTLEHIKYVKEQNNWPSDSVVLGISYMGYMTREEVIGETL